MAESDYIQRLKLDNDFRELDDALLEAADRDRVADFRPNVAEMPSSLVDRARSADEMWAERLEELDALLPEEIRRFRRLYPLVYRNGSRFTHPTSHAVDAFVTGDPPELVVDEEKALERDLALVGSGILALRLAVAVTATPTLEITLDVTRDGGLQATRLSCVSGVPDRSHGGIAALDDEPAQA